MNKLDVMTSGSEYNFADKMERPRFPSSVFDLSHTLTMSFPKKMGALVPLAVLETVPSDRFNISVSHLLRVLPQVVPLYSQMKIYIHAFYSRSSDLWTGAQIYYRKGNNGSRILKKPTLTSSSCTFIIADDGEVGVRMTENRLLHYLYGIAPGIYSAGGISGQINALPYFMYFKIWRDYFCNKYFYQNDQRLLPDDEADFRLDNNGVVKSFNSIDWQRSNSGYPVDNEGFFYRDFADDRYTSAMPSPQRGDAPTLDFDGWIKGYKINTNFDTPPTELGELLYGINNKAQVAISFPAFASQSGGDVAVSPNLSHGVYNHDRENHVWKQNQVPQTLSDGDFVGFKPDLKIFLNDIRKLAINQTELEKMARTDGSYKEFGLTFFGVSSKSANDYRPLYIGGTWQPVVFTEVVQTSGTAQGAGVLGQYAGHGISANKGNLGSIYCDDYGYIMILASIVPETLYSQGLERQHSRLYQADELIPERAKLGAQPILNKELYFTGGIRDNDLFAYQDIFDEFRYCTSKVRGYLANNTFDMYFPYTQSRYFTDYPTFSQSFATTKDNVRMDFLASQADPPFTAQFRFNIRAVRPLPYRAIPARIV